MLYGILVPLTHPAVAECFGPLFQQLKKSTNGAVNVPNGQLLTWPGTLPSARDGLADGGYLITPYARSSLPNTNFIYALF